MKREISDLCTCNSVEGSDHQHEDSGQVEVPPQTHLDKQGSRVQISLVTEKQHICQQCQQRFNLKSEDVAKWLKAKASKCDVLSCLFVHVCDVVILISL